ncbi:hypothetical protein [Streptomyces sp. WM6378]|uniref:hypothetical protein n=1 Tax=Streptomyces sp. WM6378 TaxID=1415557 RepID=UPI0006B0131B|nr:hypothetical protein [Streptomyces sp. WM6378]KOU37643.1 hypothetical protein ADK54_31550 [Streptomyces sp. WM6378]
MDAMGTPTELLLELAASSRHLQDPAELTAALQTGHRIWCTGLADVQRATHADCRGLSDDALSIRCQEAGAPWEDGASRSEAISNLVFALWDASPAAMAYTALERRAGAVGVCLLPEEDV